MADKTFFYKRWSGAYQTVHEVASVEFGASHVVFRNDDGQIILAERVEQVNQLAEHITDRTEEEAFAFYKEQIK